MRKILLMALVAFMLMSQFAHARLFDRLRARRAGMTSAPAAATVDSSGKATPAPTTAAPAPAPAPAAAAPAPPAPVATTPAPTAPAVPPTPPSK